MGCRCGLVEDRDQGGPLIHGNIRLGQVVSRVQIRSGLWELASSSSRPHSDDGDDLLPST